MWPNWWEGTRVQLGGQEVLLHTLRPSGTGMHLWFAKDTSISPTELPQQGWLMEGGGAIRWWIIRRWPPLSKNWGGCYSRWYSNLAARPNNWVSSREFQNVGFLLTCSNPNEDENNEAAPAMLSKKVCQHCRNCKCCPMSLFIVGSMWLTYLLFSIERHANNVQNLTQRSDHPYLDLSQPRHGGEL